MLDRYSRNITYLRISVTDRCNLRCIYCMPSKGVQLKDTNKILSYEEIVQVVREAAGIGISKLRITGGEPLVRRDICHLVESLKGISGIEEVSLTTNGVLLDRMAEGLKTAGLDRINVSIDTLDSQKYQEMTRGGDILRVLAGVEAAISAGFQNIKINMVILPRYNMSDIEKMESYCQEKGLVLQRINHYSLEDRESCSQDYLAERPLSCDTCNRIRLTADGKFKPCLFSDEEYPVDFSDIPSSLKQAILNKPEHGLSCTVRGNWEIGG